VTFSGKSVVFEGEVLNHVPYTQLTGDLAILFYSFCRFMST